jgi:hypothetical protein
MISNEERSETFSPSVTTAGRETTNGPLPQQPARDAQLRQGYTRAPTRKRPALGRMKDEPLPV